MGVFSIFVPIFLCIQKKSTFLFGSRALFLPFAQISRPLPQNDTDIVFDTQTRIDAINCEIWYMPYLNE